MRFRSMMWLPFGWIIWLCLTPFFAARRVYGPYGLGKLARLRTELLPDRAQPPAGGEFLDSVLERLFTARALIALGVLAVLTKLALTPEQFVAKFRHSMEDAVNDGFLVLIFAPLAVLALAVGLFTISRPEFRRGTARAVVRPIVVGLLSTVLVCMIMPVPFRALTVPVRGLVRLISADSIPMPLVQVEFDQKDPNIALAVFALWIMLFLVGASYLAHRNGLCAGPSRLRLPLLPPLATVAVIWTSTLFKLTWSGPDFTDVQRLTGWTFVLTAFGTPVAVTVLAAVEIRRLRVRHGIGFRGPLPERAVGIEETHA